MIAFVGIAVLLLVAVLLSTDRSAINLRTVGTAFFLQITIAALIMYVPYGQVVLEAVVRGVQHVINYGNEGIEFVFGDKAKENLGFTIALNVLPIIVFFSSLMSVLYYLGHHATCRCRTPAGFCTACCAP
ncbi:MAG: Na+ dependent nucleoside transporter N-terminal domain-containing protein [Woeseiaceae bacterium]|nr:Na+ dependent nucleoside transporter N-terminal domain-containing protein [Woeseiaceae bacterium]